jgi:hypothetical protein
MLKLRPEQVQAFTDSAWNRFETGAIRHLRQIFPTAVASQSDSQIRQRVRDCVPRAGRYGLTTEYQVLCFVDATYLLGESFDSNPDDARLGALLTDGILLPHDRANALLKIACTRFVNRGR